MRLSTYRDGVKQHVKPFGINKGGLGGWWVIISLHPPVARGRATRARKSLFAIFLILKKKKKKKKKKNNEK